MNPAIKGLVYRAAELGVEVVGIYDIWRGLLVPCPGTLALDRPAVRRWDRDGGTHLGSSRTNPFRAATPDGECVDRSAGRVANVELLGLGVLVAMGGEHTLGVAARLAAEGVRVVGVPRRLIKTWPARTARSTSTRRSAT